jgi:hypothetical protein
MERPLGDARTGRDDVVIRLSQGVAAGRAIERKAVPANDSH